MRLWKDPWLKKEQPARQVIRSMSRWTPIATGFLILAVMVGGSPASSELQKDSSVTALTSAPSATKAAAATLTMTRSVKQGEVVRIQWRPDDQSDTSTVMQEAPGHPQGSYTAKLGDKTIQLYPYKQSEYMGLIPISVFQKPGVYTVQLFGPHNQLVAKETVTVTDAKLPIQNIQVSKSVGGLQPEQGELETVGALKTRITPVRFWQEPFISPTVDCQNSPFGVLRYHNGKPTDDYHKGVDLRSPAGRDIKATAGGKVVIARPFRLHGGTVGIDHGQGVSSIYIHMSKILVRPGDTVDQGDVIGKVGSTGFATGPHLHWGLYVNGLPVNPNQWIKGVPRC